MPQRANNTSVHSDVLLWATHQCGSAQHSLLIAGSLHFLVNLCSYTVFTCNRIQEKSSFGVLQLKLNYTHLFRRNHARSETRSCKCLIIFTVEIEENYVLKEPIYIQEESYQSKATGRMSALSANSHTVEVTKSCRRQCTRPGADRQRPCWPEAWRCRSCCSGTRRQSPDSGG